MSTIYNIFDNGEGVQLAVGANGLILASTNGGVSWTQRTSGVTADLYDAAYAEIWGLDVFVIVGENGTVLTSEDTITWLAQPSFTLNNLYGVVFSGVFLAVGENGTFALSEDGGVTWLTTPSGTTEDLISIAADLGAYIIVGTNDTVITGLISTLALDVEVIERIVITDSHVAGAEFSRSITDSIEFADDTWWIHDALGGGTLTQSGSNQFVYINETLNLFQPAVQPTGIYGANVIENITLLSTFVPEFFRNVEGELTWPMFTLDGEILPGSILSGEVIWPLFRTEGQIQGGFQGDLIWPMFEVEGAIVPKSDVTGEIAWPMFQIEGSIVGQLQIVSGSLEVWVLNIESNHHSTYENFQPNSFGIFNGAPIAAMPGGLYELTGESDNGALIDAAIYWPPSDLSEAVMKGLEAVYLRLRGQIDDLKLIVIIDETEKRVFRVSLERDSDGNTVKRIPMPRGFKGQVYQFGIENDGGAGMNLFEMEVFSLPYKRRLK